MKLKRGLRKKLHSYYTGESRKGDYKRWQRRGGKSWHERGHGRDYNKFINSQMQLQTKGGSVKRRWKKRIGGLNRKRYYTRFMR